MLIQSLASILETTRQFQRPESTEEVHALVAWIQPQLKLIADDLSLRDEQAFKRGCQELFSEFSSDASPFSFSDNGVNVVHPYLRLELMNMLSTTSVGPEKLKYLNSFLSGIGEVPSKRRLKP